jgi:hypothetical protein
MRASQTLPESYILYKEIDLARDHRLLLFLNLLGIPLLLLCGWLFWRLALSLRPDFQTSGFRISSPGSILGILGAFIGVLILHELVHGVFFWLITNQRPYFGFRGAYAFAAAPTWYIARRPYLIVGLSPIVLITLAGVLFMPLVPLKSLVPLVFALTINAAGAIGDAAIVAWLLIQPSSILINDRGDAVSVYSKQNSLDLNQLQ